MTWRKIIASTLCLALLVLLAGCNSTQNSNVVPEFIFRYAENQGEDYPTTLGAYKFAELVSERTNGRIKIVVYHSAELGSEIECIQQLQFGGLDFARLSLSQLAEVDSSMSALQLPYLYRNDEHMWKVLDGEIGDAFLGALEGDNLIGLSWYNAGARSFYTTEPVRSFADLKDLTIRVQESSMMADMVSLLGATPTPIVYSEVYSSLRLGEVDGAENNFPSYESMSHYKVAKYYYLDEHTRVPEMQVMSKITMEKLSDEDIAIIMECAKESALFEREEWIKRQEKSQQICEESGVEIVVPTAAELQTMQELCQPLYEKYAGDSMDIVDAILQMK